MAERPIDISSTDAKAQVARAYDHCADAYADARATAAPQWLSPLSDRLAPGAAVVDIGCGCGVPIARALAERFQVTGVDISRRQIVLARRNVPAATFLLGDVMTFDLPAAGFDAAVMIYALFHLPRDDHPELLRRIGTWLKPGGMLLATLGRTGHAGYVDDDFFGTTMYWSHFSEEDYEPLLEKVGFDVIDRRRIGHGFQGAQKREREVHPLILARKVA